MIYKRLCLEKEFLRYLGIAGKVFAVAVVPAILVGGWLYCIWTPEADKALSPTTIKLFLSCVVIGIALLVIYCRRAPIIDEELRKARLKKRIIKSAENFANDGSREEG